MRTRKVLFLLFLFSCIILSMSFASAENNITLADDNINYQNNVIGVNHDDSINDEDICADSNSNNQINKNKSFSDLNTVINGDLNKKEIILYDDYSYQEGDEEFSQGIYINRSVTIDGQGHLLYFDKPSYVFHINADNVILKNIRFYNSLSMDVISCNSSKLSAINLTIAPEVILNLKIIVNDIYEIYNHTDVVNIEFETNLPNAYFWVEIPGLLEKTNLTSNSEGKASLSISNITKSGRYIISCDFIENEYSRKHYGFHLFKYKYADVILIICRENPKNNNSFNDLQALIDNSITNEINLKRDYEFFIGDKPININRSVIINGNNHIIDAKYAANIFNIQADNVIIKNVTFRNGYINEKSTILGRNFPIITDPVFIFSNYQYNAVGYRNGNFYDSYYSKIQDFGTKGGAIYCKGNNLKIIDSSFINNFATQGGGIYIDGANSQLINLSFINNTARDGGAIFNAGKNTFISKCRFNSGSSIFSQNDVNIQKCKFANDSQGVLFAGGNWKIDDVDSTYFHSFVKFGHIIFKFNLTHIHDDYYNLKIIFGCIPPWAIPPGYDPFYEDSYGFSVNKNFYLNIDGKVYNLRTDANSQVSFVLKLSGLFHSIKVYNPLTKLYLLESFTYPCYSFLNIGSMNFDKNVKWCLSKKYVFDEKTKIKKEMVILKNNKIKSIRKIVA